MNTLICTITLRQPLLATALLGEPNSSVTFGYIPGGLMRGLCIRRYLASISSPNDAAADPRFRRLFLDGTTRFLNGYVQGRDGSRTLPIPRSWQAPKEQLDKPDFPIYDTAHPQWETESWVETEDFEGSELKPLTPQFGILTDSAVTLAQPIRTITVHIARDPQKGRPLGDGQGEIFRYESLAARQSFVSIILVDQPEDVDLLTELLRDTDAWIGRSRSAHYGRVDLRVRQVPADWREISMPITEYAAGESILLTLLSPAILRNASGTLIRTPNDAILSNILGVPATLDRERSIVATTQIGGFNSTWGLPLPQSAVLDTGSVLVATLGGALSADAIQQIERTGIGERRAEGYGRVAFGWHTDTAKMRINKAQSITPRRAEPLTPLSQRFAQSMAARLQAEQIDIAIRKYANDARIRLLPERSQLARIAELIRTALPERDTSMVLSGFGQFEAVARRQFERARLDNTALDQWIASTLSKPEQVWRTLQIEGSYTRVADSAPARDEQLARHTALHLVGAVLHAANRKLREQEENN